MIASKPDKRSDRELWALIREKIKCCEYVFLKHAQDRLKDRCINDLVVLDILENKPLFKRRRNKSKDKYEEGRQDWNYCIEGIDPDKEKIRIIVSFDHDLLLVITVIRFNDEG